MAPIHDERRFHLLHSRIAKIGAWILLHGVLWTDGDTQLHVDEERQYDDAFMMYIYCTCNRKCHFVS